MFPMIRADAFPSAMQGYQRDCDCSAPWDDRVDERQRLVIRQIAVPPSPQYPTAEDCRKGYNRCWDACVGGVLQDSELWKRFRDEFMELHAMDPARQRNMQRFLARRLGR